MLNNIIELQSRLANGESLEPQLAQALLKELEHFRDAFAYLASCQAATLESLPKSTSKSARKRHVDLCLLAAEALEGNGSRIRYPEKPEFARDRCMKAAQRASQ